MTYTHHYASPLGGITMASDGEYLTGLWFDGQKYFGSTLSPEQKQEDLPVFTQSDHWLTVYFTGKAPDFTPPFSPGGTPFQKMVWKILLTIPFGQTTTYKEIARETARQMELPSMSAQAVGGAIGRNPVSLIIPCHRVIGSDGHLTGYAGGIDKKKQLLRLERPSASTILSR